MNKQLGSFGEDLAEKYLRHQKYTILQRNYYTRYGEVDIICQKDDTLVFVEVKTRRTATYGQPEESVTYRKIEHLRRAAQIYLNKSDHDYYKEIRFDVISIMLKGNKTDIRHIKAAF